MKIIKILIILLVLLFVIDICLVRSEGISIENSYSTWVPKKMELAIKDKYVVKDISTMLNRSMPSIYVEWWLHNIGYYVTKPFCGIEWVHRINLRCKNVDLERW